MEARSIRDPDTFGNLNVQSVKGFKLFLTDVSLEMP